FGMLLVQLRIAYAHRDRVYRSQILKDIAVSFIGKWGSGEVGKWGSGEVGKWGSGEVGKWGSCLITLSPQNPITPKPYHPITLSPYHPITPKTCTRSAVTTLSPDS
ncbi:MAG UNVERIFIED_CONTAM: hypothetical protein LVR29_17075, partial [Microcystis novacekii LVE1205-3]